MSTEILDGPISITRFWGGQERGVCYQLTMKDNLIAHPIHAAYCAASGKCTCQTGYMNMTRLQAVEVITRLAIEVGAAVIPLRVFVAEWSGADGNHRLIKFVAMTPEQAEMIARALTGPNESFHRVYQDEGFGL